MESLLIFCAVGIGVLVLMGLFTIMQLHALRRGLREHRWRSSRDPAPGGDAAGAESQPTLADRKKGLEDQKQLFKVFVQQFPEVPGLPKKEQFDRFRAWRKQQGL